MRSIVVGALLQAAGAQCAELPLLRLSAQQIEAAGVTYEAPRRVEQGEAASGLELMGRVVVPNSSLDLLLAPVDGRIESLQVNPGETVRAGQELATINSPVVLTLTRSLVAARSQATLAGSRAERDATLFAEGIIARNRLMESEAARDEAQALLQESRQQLLLAGFPAPAIDRVRSAADVTPRLPVIARRAGVVLSAQIGAGQAVETGSTLFELGALDVLWIEMRATREQARKLAVGATARIADCPVPAHVIATGRQLDPQSQTVVVRAELRQAGGCVSPNQYVRASVGAVAGDASLLSIPATALVRSGDKDYIFIRESGGLRPVAVSVSGRTATTAWISANLPAGALVVISGTAAVKGTWQGLGEQGREAATGGR